jgi:hypothetical protein
MNGRRIDVPGPDWRSSSAATGGMRTAPRAGPIAATTVTPTPTARLEDQRPGRQRDPEPAQQRLQPERGQHAEA